MKINLIECEMYGVKIQNIGVMSKGCMRYGICISIYSGVNGKLHMHIWTIG